MSLYVYCTACHHRQQSANLTCDKCGAELARNSISQELLTLGIAAGLTFALALALFKSGVAMSGEPLGLWVAVFFASFGPVLFRTWTDPDVANAHTILAATLGALGGTAAFLGYAGGFRILYLAAAAAIALVGGAAARQLGG